MSEQNQTPGEVETANHLEKSTTPPVTPATFNLVIATSSNHAKKIVAHYGLHHVRFLDDIHHIPSGGPMRGEALNRILGEYGDEIPTVVVIQEAGWVTALLNDMQRMAPMVWRAIESKLLGHRTDHQRNLLIVAGDFKGSCQEAGALGLLRTWSRGHKAPDHWRTPRSTAKTPAPKPVQKLETKKPTPPKPTAKIKNASLSGEVRNPSGFQVAHHNSANPNKSGKQGPKPTPTHQHQRPNGTAVRLHDDLYLLAKGHYGAFGSDEFYRKAALIVAHHLGIRVVSDELLVIHLFRTLVSKSTRGHWGGFNLLQEVSVAGSRGPRAVIEVFSGWIGIISARDAGGNEIPQPQMDAKLYAKLNVVQQNLTAPTSSLPEQADDERETVTGQIKLHGDMKIVPIFEAGEVIAKTGFEKEEDGVGKESA